MNSPSPSPARDNRVRYETRDVRFRPLAAALAGLLLLLVLVTAAVNVLFQRWSARTDRPRPDLDRAALAHELQRLRQRERERLQTYGWVSRRDGVVRIPIERAIELVTEPPPSEPVDSPERPEAPP